MQLDTIRAGAHHCWRTAWTSRNMESREEFDHTPKRRSGLGDCKSEISRRRDNKGVLQRWFRRVGRYMLGECGQIWTSHWWGTGCDWGRSCGWHESLRGACDWMTVDTKSIVWRSSEMEDEMDSPATGDTTRPRDVFIRRSHFGLEERERQHSRLDRSQALSILLHS